MQTTDWHEMKQQNTCTQMKKFINWVELLGHVNMWWTILFSTDAMYYCYSNWPWINWYTDETKMCDVKLAIYVYFVYWDVRLEISILTHLVAIYDILCTGLVASDRSNGLRSNKVQSINSLKLRSSDLRLIIIRSLFHQPIWYHVFEMFLCLNLQLYRIQ